MPGTTQSIKKYEETFLRELSRLNEAQREAVEQIEGQVLVIAGPGTGKTHILSARIGRILAETDAQPHNILCLTFTEAGVRAMRERLLEFIGPEAHRAHVFTFHSFCNSIIQDHLELFGRRDLEPLSDLERVEIIRRIIDELELNHPLKKGRADVYFYEGHLFDLFKRMKSENWPVAYVHQKIEVYLRDLPKRKEFIYQLSRGDFKKGDLKTAKYEETVEKMERLRAAVDLFPKYVEEMRKYRRYDYEDMILWVLQAFEKHPALLRNYQEQYLYFLVDEYQDTNGAQNAIVQKLVEYWDNPNLFIVGDDDQSIYEFQGARLKNLTDFYEKYQQHSKLVLLQKNYRSSQPILDTAHSLILQNENRIVNNLKSLGIEKILFACHEEFSKTAHLPTIAEYPNQLQEAVDIVRQIEELQQEGFPLQEVAIIYARHKQVHDMLTLLEKKGIPYHTRRKVNILDLPIIQNLRLLLEYLQAEFTKPYSGEHLLFKILHFDFLKIQPQDLAKLAIRFAKFEWKERPKWRDVLADEAFLGRLNLKNEKAFWHLSNLVNRLLSGFANLPVNAFIERLINRSGLLQHILQQEEKIWLLQALNSFVGFVEKECDRRPRLRIVQLLETLNNMDANRLPIELNKTIHSEEGLQLLTAHSSKGLEFRRVFLIDCIKDHWEPAKRRFAYRFPFPDTLTFSGEEDAMEARRRLFYVAMTRAKEGLHISYSRQKKDGKELQRALFVDEILKNANLTIQVKQLPVEALMEAQILLLSEVKPSMERQDEDAIVALLEGFSLSVSAMNKMLRCPLSFYYENVLKAPTVSSEAASYGTAMHNALQRGFEKMLSSKQKKFPTPKEFVRFFEYEIRKLYGNFSKKEFERRLEMGRQHLSDYCRQHRNDWTKRVRLEFELRNVEVEGVPINGTIDRLDLLDDFTAHEVDYKTGSHNESKIKRPSKSNEYGGSYWRQLVFYKILFENYRNNPRKVKTAEISYLRPDGKGVFISKKIDVRESDVLFVKKLIRQTYRKIIAHEFYEGCGEANCSWCNFIRHNVAVDSFSDEEIEALDDR